MNQVWFAIATSRVHVVQLMYVELYSEGDAAVCSVLSCWLTVSRPNFHLCGRILFSKSMFIDYVSLGILTPGSSQFIHAEMCAGVSIRAEIHDI